MKYQYVKDVLDAGITLKIRHFEVKMVLHEDGHKLYEVIEPEWRYQCRELRLPHRILYFPEYQQSSVLTFQEYEMNDSNIEWILTMQSEYAEINKYFEL